MKELQALFCVMPTYPAMPALTPLGVKLAVEGSPDAVLGGLVVPVGGRLAILKELLDVPLEVVVGPGARTSGVFVGTLGAAADEASADTAVLLVAAGW